MSGRLKRKFIFYKQTVLIVFLLCSIYCKFPCFYIKDIIINKTVFTNLNIFCLDWFTIDFLRCICPERNKENIILVTNIRHKLTTYSISDRDNSTANLFPHHKLFPKHGHDQVLPTSRGETFLQPNDPFTAIFIGTVLNKKNTLSDEHFSNTTGILCYGCYS